MRRRAIGSPPVAMLCGLLAAVVGAAPVDAEITRLVITSVESPTFEGVSFGAVGRYEKLRGRAFGEIDPADRRNAVIVDIGLAPKNALGKVEYSMDVLILRPIDRGRASGQLLFHMNNRGNIGVLASLNDGGGGNNPTSARDAGNGFLMRNGYTIVSSGWDPSVRSGTGQPLTIAVPVARNADGSSIVGPSLDEFVVDTAAMATATLTYPAATTDKAKASLTVREHYSDAPLAIASAGWEYTSAEGTAIRLLPAGTMFQRGRLYEFIYPAKDPLVAGLGFAATRDLGAFLRDAVVDADGNRNPLAGSVRAIYTHCTSQPCRMMRDFVHLGFNESLTGHKVFDGILNWVAGASGIFLNFRFAQPDRTQRQRIGRWYPERQFPFAYQTSTDPVTKTTAGRLERCAASTTCPNIFEINSSNEYWVKVGSALTVDSGGSDLPEPPGVRNYLLASLPHGAANGLGSCAYPRNPLGPGAILRALLIALDEWTSAPRTSAASESRERSGAEGAPASERAGGSGGGKPPGTELRRGAKLPPESQVPRVRDQTAVNSLPQAIQGFPQIPGIFYNGLMSTGDVFDFGPSFAHGIVTRWGPPSGSPYPAFVPKTDADGNDIPGIRLPDIEVPVASYAGWNRRATGVGFPDLCDGAGMRIEFAKTKAERLAAGDPRPSIEERYASHAAYVERVKAAALKLRAQRLMLDEDVERYVAAAEASAVGK